MMCNQDYLKELADLRTKFNLFLSQKNYDTTDPEVIQLGLEIEQEFILLQKKYTLKS